jgi:methionyl-tRNA formyltransferase
MYIDSNAYKDLPGSLVKFNREGIVIKTANSAIVITHIQFPNKKTISSADAFNSYLDFFTN